MRLLLASLAVLALCACPASNEDELPPPLPSPSDAGSAGGLEVTFPLTVVRGGSTFGVVSTNGGAAVSGLGIEGPEYLTFTLESDAVQPGKPVLLRIDAQAGAQQSADAAVGAPVAFRVFGTSEGEPVQVEASVSVLRESDFSGRCVNALVHPSQVDVSAGAPVTVEAIVFPCTSLHGTLSLHATSAGLFLPAIRFDPPSVEVDGLEPVIVRMTVGGELRLPQDSRVEFEAWLDRAKAVAAPFDVVARPPELPVVPSIQIAQPPPEDLYLRPGTSVPLDLTGANPALRFTAWEILDLPAGMVAAAVNGVITFDVSAGAPSGAHHVRLRGTREGQSQEWKVRLLVARVDGDWPLLGDSPTEKDAQGYGSAGAASLAVDAAGAVHVACASNEDSKQDVRVFEDGRWRVEGQAPGCVAPSFDSTSGGGLLCAAAMDTTYQQAVAQCWSSGSSPLGRGLRLPAKGLALLLGGDVLVTLEGVDDRASLYRWDGNTSWSQVTQKTVPLATLLDVASLPPQGLLLATMKVEDRLTPQGWTQQQVVEIARHDGQAWIPLGEVGSQTEFDGNDASTFPFADPRQAVELEVAPDGRPVVAWIDSSDERIHVGAWDGTQWQPMAATALATTPGFFAYELKMKVDAASRPVLAWLEAGFPESEWSGGRMDRRPCHVRVHRLGAAGWEELSSAPLNLDAAGPARNVSLALDASGRPHVSWEEAGSIFVTRSSR